MKKTLLLFILTAAMQQILAQSLNFGIKAGLNESTVKGDAGTTFSNLAGFNAGLIADINFNKITVEPGVYYTTNGYNSKSDFALSYSAPLGYYMRWKVVYNYLNVPVNILFNIQAGPLKIFAGGGPYWEKALSGTSTGTEFANGNTIGGTPSKLSFGRDGTFSESDFGLNALGGISLKNGLLFTVNYGYGLTNIVSNGDEEIKNRVLSISLGYKFL